jgi:hypothetical protein
MPPGAAAIGAAAMLSDNDLLRRLAEIEVIALEPYPYEQHDPRLPFALGKIADIAAAALRAAPAPDNRNHIPSPTCWCNPVPDDSEPDVWIHHYQPTQHAALQGEDAAR